MTSPDFGCCPTLPGHCECNLPRCPECGYTKHDAGAWCDHDRCKGKIPEENGHNTDWNECDHEWAIDPTDWDNELAEQVICTKCNCPGERDKDGKVFWPTT